MGNHNWVTSINIQYRVDTEAEVMDLQKLYRDKYNIKSFTYKYVYKEKNGEVLEEYYLVDIELLLNDKKEQEYDVNVDIQVHNK